LGFKTLVRGDTNQGGGKTVREDETGLVISLKLIPNPELTQLILSYGADVNVLKPVSLHERITEIWERAIKVKSRLEKNSKEG
jgi:predicted DNA-binding transcriptional regulator YafY